MQKILDDIYREIPKFYGQGEVASYIPELAKVDPHQFSMSIATVDGKVYSTGASQKTFSIQSISKVFVLALAMKELENKLWHRIGKEPSGTAFNSLIQLESENGKPRNPFINAGALVTTDIVVESADDPIAEILSFVRTLSQNPNLQYDLNVANSELSSSDRNAALTHFMKSFGNISSNTQELLSVYCHHCSLAMSTEDLAKSFLFLANEGINPFTKEAVLPKLAAKRILALMLTCGLYDNVGEFAYRVGLPAKSGVGGGIVAVLPGKYTVCVWSPALNKSGNSFIGTKALELLTEATGESIF